MKKVDIIPLIPIIENSGGKISNWRGESDISNGDILVSSNGILHTKMISKLKKFEIMKKYIEKHFIESSQVINKLVGHQKEISNIVKLILKCKRKQ